MGNESYFRWRSPSSIASGRTHGDDESTIQTFADSSLRKPLESFLEASCDELSSHHLGRMCGSLGVLWGPSLGLLQGSGRLFWGYSATTLSESRDVFGPRRTRVRPLRGATHRMTADEEVDKDEKRRANVAVEEERGEDREGEEGEEEEEVEDNRAFATPRTGRIAMMSFVLYATSNHRHNL